MFARLGYYKADTAGFGFVDPGAYAPGQPDIQILYPNQEFNKISVGYEGRALGWPVADKATLVAYRQDNDRRLVWQG